MRRVLLTLSAVFALVVLANPVEAQFKIGVQGAMITSAADIPTFELNGKLGAGARLMLDPPLFPLALVGGFVYYKPDCADCKYWTASLAAQLRIPLPLVAPYVIGGLQTRRTTAGPESDAETGIMLGAGVQVNLGLSLFLEGTLELSKDDVAVAGIPDLDSPIVIKGGILIG